MRAQEAMRVLERYRDDLDAVWSHDPKEYCALEKYIVYVSDSEHAVHRVKAYTPHEVLFVFTGRLPAQGMASFMQSLPTFYDARHHPLPRHEANI